MTATTKITTARQALIDGLRAHQAELADTDDHLYSHLANLTDEEVHAILGKTRSFKPAVAKLVIWAAEWATLAAEEDDEEATRGMAATLNRYKSGYLTCVAYSGTKSLNNGDDVASLLEYATPSEVCAIADVVLGEDAGYHADRYDGLNPGQQRMNSGNRIRGAVERGAVTMEEVQAAHKGIHKAANVVTEQEESTKAANAS